VGRGSIEQGGRIEIQHRSACFFGRIRVLKLNPGGNFIQLKESMPVHSFLLSQGRKNEVNRLRVKVALRIRSVDINPQQISAWVNSRENFRGKKGEKPSTHLLLRRGR